MMFLVMCEGPNEQEIISILLENGLLSISFDDLVGGRPFFARQVRDRAVFAQLRIYTGDYQKYKNRMSAKEYAKANIILNGIRYNNRSKFYREYYGRNPKKLADAIKEYKRLHKTHDKDQLFLADLLKE